MRKLIILVIALICLVCVLTGCGNMSMGVGNYTFKHIHISDAIDGYCATVEKWYDNENGIEVKTSEYGSVYLAEGTYMLFGEATHCPYCK